MDKEEEIKQQLHEEMRAFLAENVFGDKMIKDSETFEPLVKSLCEQYLAQPPDEGLRIMIKNLTLEGCDENKPVNLQELFDAQGGTVGATTKVFHSSSSGCTTKEEGGVLYTYKCLCCAAKAKAREEAAKKAAESADLPKPKP